MEPSLKSKLFRYWRPLGCLMSIPLAILALYYRPIKSLRTRLDCLTESTSVASDALNAYYVEHDEYFALENADSTYCNVQALRKAGLQISESWESGPYSKIKFKGDPIDPFRQSPITEDEEKGGCWYYHYHSAEFWARISGYPLRYYCSKDRKWAVLISNGPDGDIDLEKEQLDMLQFNSGTDLNQIYERLQPHVFRLDVNYSQSEFDEDNGPYTSGDSILLMLEGERLRKLF